MLSLALTVALAAAPEPANAFFIILGGGTTMEAAEAVRHTYLAGRPEWRQQLVRAREGWPRVLRSDTVPGLRPGFFIAALGACPFEQSTVVGVSAWSLEGTYARKVTWAGKDDCPTLGPRLEVKALGELKSPQRTVRVVVARAPGVVVASLGLPIPILEVRDAKGEVLEVRGADVAGAAAEFEAEGPATGSPEAVAVDGGAVVIDLKLRTRCVSRDVRQVTRLEGARVVTTFEVGHATHLCGD